MTSINRKLELLCAILLVAVVSLAANWLLMGARAGVRFAPKEPELSLDGLTLGMSRAQVRKACGKSEAPSVRFSPL